MGRGSEAHVFLEPHYRESLGDIGRRSIEAAVYGLREATDLLPDRHEAWYHMARGLAFLGRPDEAHSAARRCLDVAR